MKIFKNIWFWLFFASLTIGATYTINSDLNIAGDLTYQFRHSVGSADSIVPVYEPAVTRYVYTKINTGAFVSHEDDLITTAGDSIKILKAGDYYIAFNITLAGGSNSDEQLRVKIYSDNIPQPLTVGRFVFYTTSTTKFDNFGYFWYLKDVAADTWLSFRITNFTNSNDPKISDYKVCIEKKPE
jgi:hypothetical protein